MEIPSLSVLQLELDDLRDSMNSVQSEVAQCLTSLNSQNLRVCDAVSRLETVTAIVKAINMIKVKHTPDLNFSSKVSNSLYSDNNVDDIDIKHVQPDLLEDKHASLNPSSYETVMESKIEHEDTAILDVSTVRPSNESCLHSDIKHNDIKGVGREDGSIAGKDNVKEVGIAADTSLDHLSSTRPTLKKKCKDNVKNEVLNGAKASSSHTDTGVSIPNSVKTSLNQCSAKVSFHGSLTSCQATTSVKMSVNKVKEMCRKQGWKLEGRYSTRAGKEDCPAVHFYEVIVKMKQKDEVVRGVGGTRNDAIKRAFKSMEPKLKEADNEDNANVEIEDGNTMKGSSDNLVNFAEDPSLPSNLFASSEDFVPQPPVYHAQDCDEYYTSVNSGSKRAASTSDKRKLTVSNASGSEIVIKGLTVSSRDAGTLIGTWGSTIKKLEESTGVKISVLGKFGDKKQPVQVKGKADQVSLALEMIEEIIGAS